MASSSRGPSRARHSVGRAELDEPVAAVAKQERLLRDSIEGNTFQVSFSQSKFSYDRAILSMVRAAYLATFAAVGLQFARALTPIRAQLGDPNRVDRSLIQRLVRFDNTESKDRRLLAMITEPRERWSMLLGFGRWTAAIPLAKDSAFYTAQSSSFHYSGSIAAFPCEPTFGLTQDALDHHERDDRINAVVRVCFPQARTCKYATAVGSKAGVTSVRPR